MLDPEIGIVPNWIRPAEKSMVILGPIDERGPMPEIRPDTSIWINPNVDHGGVVESKDDAEIGERRGRIEKCADGVIKFYPKERRKPEFYVPVCGKNVLPPSEKGTGLYDHYGKEGWGKESGVALFAPML